jgi:hypothetical protein
MMGAIYFYCQAVFVAVEIENVRPWNLLPSKLGSPETAPAQMLPQASFNFSLVGAQLSWQGRTATAADGR